MLLMQSLQFQKIKSSQLCGTVLISCPFAILLHPQRCFSFRLIWERMKLVVEPSGAVPLAVVLDESFRKSYPGVKRVCVVFSGGNVDLDAWHW